MLTEEEAKTKRCCGPDGAGINVIEEQAVPMATGSKLYTVKKRMCIGSACMAWRVQRLPGRYDADGYRLDPSVTSNPPDAYAEKFSDSPALGYCGLAGRP